MTDVLVVDDEASVRTSVAEILRGAGYAVEEASDGLAALAVLRDHQVRAMVLDVRMPGCDGIAVVEALEEPPPIVMVSAHVFRDDDVARLGGKVGAMLTKPVPPEHLLEEVERAVRRGERR